VPGDRQDPLAICHDYVLALPADPESNLLEGPNSVEMIDTRDARHRLCDLDLAYIGMLEELIPNREVLSDSIANVLEGFGFGCAF
jgi:hypothetical protein